MYRFFCTVHLNDTAETYTREVRASGPWEAREAFVKHIAGVKCYGCDELMGSEWPQEQSRSEIVVVQIATGTRIETF